MSELVVFNDEEKDRLAGILYAVGIWMSHADDTDEDTVSEEREQQRFIAQLKHLADNKDVSILVRELMMEVLNNDLKWKTWETRAESVLTDVPKALATLRRHHMNDQVIIHYKKVLMILASGVAKAAREEPEGMPISTGFWSTISQGLNEFLMILGNKDRFEALNISPAEDTHLTELYTVLKQN
jgi:hypothetical protein